jgi:hypothetical protein
MNVILNEVVTASETFQNADAEMREALLHHSYGEFHTQLAERCEEYGSAIIECIREGLTNTTPVPAKLGTLLHRNLFGRDDSDSELRRGEMTLILAPMMLNAFTAAGQG